MTDWHSHILPGIDDGSANVEESHKLIQMLKEQGISKIVATPHFLADRFSIDSFIEKRDRAAELLREKLPEEHPEIILGAEVYYYSGISALDGLDRLCIGGSRYLLLEMPLERWTEYTVSELIKLASSSSITLVLAHIERYYKIQSKETWRRLYAAGVLMQVNASFFNDVKTRRKAMSMLKKQQIHFVGSDCHNTTSRPPQIGRALEIIEKKLGSKYLEYLSQTYLSYTE